MMRRVIVHIPDDMYHKIHLKAQASTIGVSAIIRQTLAEKFTSSTSQVHVPSISDRMNNLNHKPTPEPMSDDAVDQACFKSYRDDGGQINNIKAWKEAGKPAPEQNQ